MLRLIETGFDHCLFDHQYEMNAMKSKVFHDLERPMAFASTLGFEERDVTTTKKYGNNMYFSGTRGEWFVTTPPATVVKASVNQFKNGQHELTIQCPQTWADTATHQLKEALRIAHPDMQQSGVEFDTVWAGCVKPNFVTLQISTQYTAKRTKVNDYVSMYNNENEITDVCDLCAGCLVQCSVRFVLTEKYCPEDDCMETRVRCEFGAGIRVLKMAGAPDCIKRPWNWDAVDFDSLSSPMYDSVRVKTGSMVVTDVSGRVATVRANPDFEQALKEFHARADADAWNQTITVNKSIEPDCVAVATVVPTRNKRHITWTAATLSSQKKRRRLDDPPSTQESGEAKTDDGNTDSSSGNQTTD